MQTYTVEQFYTQKLKTKTKMKTRNYEKGRLLLQRENISSISLQKWSNCPLCITLFMNRNHSVVYETKVSTFHTATQKLNF